MKTAHVYIISRDARPATAASLAPAVTRSISGDDMAAPVPQVMDQKAGILG